MRATAGQVTFVHEGQKYTLEFDFAAIAFFEREADASILDVFEMLQGGGRPRISHLAWLIQAGLQKHHPGTDLNAAGTMVADPDVLESLGAGLTSAMPDAEPSAEGNGPRQGRSGTKRSRGRSKPG